MEIYSIRNTTREQRIALIKSWEPEVNTGDGADVDDIDIWELYRDYIDGKKEISECNASAMDDLIYIAEYEKNEKREKKKK